MPPSPLRPFPTETNKSKSSWFNIYGTLGTTEASQDLAFAEQIMDSASVGGEADCNGSQSLWGAVRPEARSFFWFECPAPL